MRLLSKARRTQLHSGQHTSYSLLNSTTYSYSLLEYFRLDPTTRPQPFNFKTHLQQGIMPVKQTSNPSEKPASFHVGDIPRFPCGGICSRCDDISLPSTGCTWSRFRELTHSGDRGTYHPGIIQEWLHMVSLPRAESQWRYGHMSPWNHTRMVTHGLASQSGLTVAIGAHVTLESYKNGYTRSRFPERTHSGDRGTYHPGIIQEWLHMVSLPRAESQWRYGHMSPWNHTRMVTHGLASQSGLTVAIGAHVTLESYKNGCTWSRFPELTHSGDRGTCHPGIIQEWLHMVSLPRADSQWR